VRTPSLRLVSTDDLTPDEVATLRALFDAAWASKDGAFSEDDWRSATGGTHVIVDIDGSISSHASVVPRTLETGGHALRTGYVEAVATWPDQQGRGLATEVMRATAGVVDAFELGALDTGIPGFYERLGWERWLGPTACGARGDPHARGGRPGHDPPNAVDAGRSRSRRADQL